MCLTKPNIFLNTEIQKTFKSKTWYLERHIAAVVQLLFNLGLFSFSSHEHYKPWALPTWAGTFLCPILVFYCNFLLFDVYCVQIKSYLKNNIFFCFNVLLYHVYVLSSSVSCLQLIAWRCANKASWLMLSNLYNCSTFRFFVYCEIKSWQRSFRKLWNLVFC